ncbi:hypothetical protein ACFWE3_02565 [Mycobacteriaceae bacterium NPDC060252]
MRAWLRRNILGAVLMLIGLLIFGITIGYPDWRENLGANKPVFTVPAGATVKIDGVLWRLRVPDMPAPTFSKFDQPQPPNTRFVAYAFDRSQENKPAGLGEGWGTCIATVVGNDGRRWDGQVGLRPVSIGDWERAEGYSPNCGSPGAFLTVMLVPSDAAVAAVDITFVANKGSTREHHFVRFTTPS